MMAERPVFIPNKYGSALVVEVPVTFQWHPGMAPSQKKKNVVSLHSAAISHGLNNLLEISSKSSENLGIRLSAFNLILNADNESIPMESAYQGSKVFRFGGPYTDLYFKSPRDAKKDIRLKESGDLIRFNFFGKDYPLLPKTAFYDWLYIKCLYPHRQWIIEHAMYDGYTDIEFNPKKSINCQARAFAEFIALYKRDQLDASVNDFFFFSNLLPEV